MENQHLSDDELNQALSQIDSWNLPAEDKAVFHRQIEKQMSEKQIDEMIHAIKSDRDNSPERKAKMIEHYEALRPQKPAQEEQKQVTE